MIKTPKRIKPTPGWRPPCDHDDCYEFWWAEMRTCFWHYPQRLTCLKTGHKTKWLQLTPMKSVESRTGPTYYRFTPNDERFYAGTSAQVFDTAIDALSESYGTELWLGQACSDHFSNLKRFRNKSMCGYLRYRVLWRTLWPLIHASMACALKEFKSPIPTWIRELIDTRSRFPNETIVLAEITKVSEYMESIGTDHPDWKLYSILLRYFGINGNMGYALALSRDFFNALRAHSKTGVAFVNSHALRFVSAEDRGLKFLVDRKFELARKHLDLLVRRQRKPPAAASTSAPLQESSP